MKIFSLDTSFSFFNFSVIEDGKVKLVYLLDSERKTLENLPSLLKSHGIDLSSFDAFAVSKGVGYLTALRIGITFMKTTSYVLKKPIVGYENLYLMCKYVPVEFPKVAYLKVSNYIFYRVAKEEDLISDIKIYEGEKLEGAGITLSAVAEEEITNKTVKLSFFPFSAYGGIYAFEVLKESPKGDDPFLLEPVYLRPPA